MQKEQKHKNTQKQYHPYQQKSMSFDEKWEQVEKSQQGPKEKETK